MLCKLEGCQKPSHGYGMCVSHWRRWRMYGDPLAGRVARGVPEEFIAQAVLYQGDDCLPWPYANKQGGYGKLKRRLVTHIVCETVHGPRPSMKHDAAHACGNPPCINPRHLRWDTRKGNCADKRLHGTQAQGEQVIFAKLTAAEVIAIRSRPNRTQVDLAREYGVSIRQIRNILTHKVWRHIP
jgi:hypothetical protein